MARELIKQLRIAIALAMAAALFGCATEDEPALCQPSMYSEVGWLSRNAPDPDLRESSTRLLVSLQQQAAICSWIRGEPNGILAAQVTVPTDNQDQRAEAIAAELSKAVTDSEAAIRSMRKATGELRQPYQTNTFNVYLILMSVDLEVGPILNAGQCLSFVW